MWAESEEARKPICPSSVADAPRAHDVNLRHAFEGHPGPTPILCRLRRGLHLGQEVHLPQQSAEHLVYVFI